MPKLTSEQASALFAKGLISEELYDSLTQSENKQKAFIAEANKAAAEVEEARKAMPVVGAAVGGPGQYDPTYNKSGPFLGAAPAMPTGNTPVNIPTGNPNPLFQNPLASNKVPVDPEYDPEFVKTPASVNPSDLAVQPKPQQLQPTQSQPSAVAPVKPKVAAGPTKPKDPYAFLTPGEKARMAELGAEAERSKGITKQSTDLMMKQEQEVANIRSRQASEYEAMVKNDQARRKDEDLIIQENITKLQTEADNLSKKKIDPTRAFSSLGTANKITAGIGLLLGSFGTKKGGSNQAMETINKFIDRDIQAQEFDIKNEGAVLNTKRGLLSDRMNQFQNLDLARAAAKKDYLDVIDMQVKKVLAGTSSEKVRIQGEEMLGMIDAAKSKALFDFSNLNDQRARASAAAAVAKAARAEERLYEDYKARREHGFKMEEEETKARVGYEKEQRGNRIEVLGEKGEPTVYTARNAEAGKTISEAEVARQTLKGLISEARQLRAQYGGETLPTAAKARMQQLQGEMLGQVKSLDKLGTLDKGVERLGEKLIPDLTEYNFYGQDSVITMLDGLEKKADNNLRTVLRSNTTPGQVEKNTPSKPDDYGFKPNK
jgi:hypothetical protein